LVGWLGEQLLRQRAAQWSPESLVEGFVQQIQGRVEYVRVGWMAFHLLWGSLQIGGSSGQALTDEEMPLS
jgi:hypothetical protein